MSGDTINSDLIRGNIDTIILRALYEGDRYGYDILKEIEQRSKGKYQLKQPTLYSCLKRLETQGFIKSYWGAKSIGGRRKYFTLTDMGKEVFVHNKADWEYSRTLIDALIAMGDDSSALPSQNTDSTVDNFENESAIREESFDEQDNFIEEPEEYDAHEEYDVKDEQDTASEPSTNRTENYGDAVVFIDDKQYYDDDDSTAVSDSSEQNLSTDETSDQEVDLIYSSDYSEKQSYIGTMRDKTYTPETVDVRFADFEKGLSNQETLPVDEEDFFEDSDDTYQEHGEIENPIDFKAKNTTNNYSPQEETPAPKTEFYNYHSDIGKIENVALPESDGRSLLDKLDEKAKSMPSYTPPVPAPQPQPQPIQSNNNSDTEQPDTNQPEFNFAHKLQIRKFDTVIQNASKYGNEVKIKQHNDNVGREYNKKFYYYSHKLALYKYAILFGIMLLEIILTYCIIQFGIKPVPSVSSLDKTIYILSVVFAAAFPLVTACLYRFYYDTRKRSNFNLWYSLAYRLIFMAQAILIIYALNIYFGMPVSTSSEYYVSFILPSVLSTNIPVAAIIFNKLLKSGKFNVGA